MSEQHYNASPKKLRNGSWGAVVEYRGRTPREADRLTVQTRAGKSWGAEIQRVVWSGDGAGGKKIAIVATRSLDGGPKRGAKSGGRSVWCRCGNAEEPMSMGFARYAGQTIKCPDCGGKLEVC